MWIFEPTAEEIAHPKRCRTCGAEIVFAKTKADKIAPLNAWFKVLRTQKVGEAELVEVANEASHFASCSYAKHFRRVK